jgi:hypothetical protein
MENSPEAIDYVLSHNFECEVDVWYQAERGIFLGHDSEKYSIDINWILERSTKLWLHCKNFEALSYFLKLEKGLNLFWHQEDDHVLTSKGYIWSYPGKKVDKKTIGVLPEIWDDSQMIFLESCLGICTDYPRKFDEELNGSTLR